MTPGWAFSNAVASVLKTLFNDAAASTVSGDLLRPLRDPDGLGDAGTTLCPPHAASGGTNATGRQGTRAGICPSGWKAAAGTATPLRREGVLRWGSGAVDVHAGGLHAGGGLHAHFQSQLLDRFPGQQGDQPVGPAWISTCAATSPSVTAVTIPGKALRAEV